MMSLNRADELRRDLEEKHGVNAEQANGILMVVDEMVETGFDRMLKSIADSESRMTKEMVSLRTELGKDIASLRSELTKDIGSVSSIMNERFKSSNRLFMIIQALVPFASAVITIGLLVALANLGSSLQSVLWLI